MDEELREAIIDFDLPNPLKQHTMKRVYDFHYCLGRSALRVTLEEINRCGYELISVTQRDLTYTVFFRRSL